MAVKIGILGENTTATTGATSVYTVGSDLAARVRVSFQVEGPAAVTNWSVRIGTPSNQATVHKSTTSGLDVISGSNYEAVPDPSLSLKVNKMGGNEGAGLLDLSDADNAGLDEWTGPLPADYFLSTGDTVRYNIGGTAATAVLFQVQGVEDDA
jgi:hypothetical protein